MPTEQEAKPAVVTPSLQQWRSPSTFRGAPGEDPLKWLKRNLWTPIPNHEEIVQRRSSERVLAPVSTKPTETRPRPTCASITGNARAPVQKFPPEPRNTDVWENG
ncbi:hypothetical protein TNCV_3999731 [Trichonephila clavipes]|nr:hypothetical protein TNCV_3999731 [Trichonephila clavipes]